MNRRFCFARTFGLLVLGLVVVVVSSNTGNASCGSVTCFVVIGSQQQVSPQGLWTVNLFYNYTQQQTVLPGTTGIIPAVDVRGRQMVLNDHQEVSTITQMLTLDLNYGITDRLGIQVAIPYKTIVHHHVDSLGVDNDGAGTPTRFSDAGIGDIFINGKYNWLPTLRSMVVTGIGVYLPTGNNQAADPSGGIFEPTAQLGRGQFGLQGSLYQTYELIPHRLNQFLSASYRHTFKNNWGYQFGDQYDLGGGLNLVTTDWLVLSAQVNYRYMVHDTFSSSLARAPQPGEPQFGVSDVVVDPNVTTRRVPTTGSSFTAITPGFTLGVGQFVKYEWAQMTRFYVFAQVPVARDFNGNLAQGVSYMGGITQYFK